MDLIIIIVLLGSFAKCLVNGNGMLKIELEIMMATCQGKSCDGYEFKICYAENGETLHSKCLELYDILSINNEPAFYQRFDTELKPLYGIDLTALPYTFILYFNDEALYDTNVRPQDGTSMVLTFQSERSFIQISLTSECFDVRHCTGFLCNKCFIKPPIVTVPETKTGSIGGNLTIPCNVSELYSDTVIRWFKHNGSINTTIDIRERERFFGGTNKSPDLIIISVQREDEGNYICQAINLEFEGSSQPVYLSILEYPVVNVPNIEPAIEGTNITIPCYVSPTTEVTKITWYTNNSILNIYGNNRFSGGTISTPSLKIYFVEENDAGNYTCQAMNPVGIGKSVPTYLQVLPDIPQVHLQGIEPVVNGSNITIGCYISSGSKLMSVTLVNNNVTIYTSNASKLRKTSNESKMYVSLTICSVQKEHEGTFICRAHNTAGNDGYSKPFQLIVHEDIPFRVLVSIIEAVNNRERITISCNFSSVSKLAKIIKFENDIDLNLNHIQTNDSYQLNGRTLQSPLLTSYSVRKADEGNCTCKKKTQMEQTCTAYCY